jgi:hypothetical protein
MKILVYEKPEEHDRRTLYPPVAESIATEGGESRLAKSLLEANTLLSQEKFDAIIIHHANYSALEYLKPRYPLARFAAISALLLKREKCRPGSLAEDFRSQCEENYEFILDDYDKSIWEMMKKIKA